MLIACSYEVYLRRSPGRPAGRAARTVFVASKRPRKPSQNDQRLQSWAEKESLRAEQAKESEYLRKLTELKTLTKNVQSLIRRRQQQDEKQKQLDDIPLPSQVDRDVEKVYGAIDSPKTVSTFDPATASLVTPAVELPKPIEDRLGLAVKYLVSKKNQNWALVLKTLDMSGGFKDMVPRDIRKFLYAIPLPLLAPLVPEIERLLADADVPVSPKMVNTFIKSLSLGSAISPENQARIDKYIDHLRQTSKNGVLSRDSYEILVTYFGKLNDLEKLNSCLVEMKAHNLNPSPNVYNNVLTFAVYKARDHKQAVSVFDSMKFLSTSMKPNTTAYQDIIVSYVNNDDIEKALDLYHEMITSKIPLNQEIMVALARGCMSRKVLKYKAWDFMFEIYENNWTPSLGSLEYMLYLASKDGDLALSRALYRKLASSGSTSKKSFNFLLMAYYSVKLSSMDPPVITMHEKGRHFRRNLLNEADSLQSAQSPDSFVPFLPVLDLTTDQEIMAESSALWAHTSVFRPQFINKESYNSYLNVAAEYGTLEEFQDRYSFSELISDPAIKGSRVIVEEAEPLDVELEELESAEPGSRSKDITKSPILNQLAQKSSVKITRSTITYMIALKAAYKNMDYNLAQAVWSERGLYRRSHEFKSLKIAEKDKLDFQFANSMVQCLTNLKLLDDALAIVVSTEYQFKWSWTQLSQLYQSCVNIGKDNSCRTIRSIAQRAQIRFEGKIRKRDYKEYVMKRGY